MMKEKRMHAAPSIASTYDAMVVTNKSDNHPFTFKSLVKEFIEMSYIGTSVFLLRKYE